VREDPRSVYDSTRRDSVGTGGLRHHIPAADGPYEFGTPPRFPGGHANSGGPRPTPSKSWQARNRWYSRTIVAASIGTLIILFVLEILR
jgi:hypothetical protein